jgi:hypothetical protein
MSKQTFVLQTPVDQFGRCWETSITIFDDHGQKTAWVDYHAGTPFACGIEQAREIARQHLEAGYKFV